MSVRYLLQDSMVVIECQGEITAREFVDNRARMAVDPAVPGTPLMLVDLAGVTRFAVEASEVWGLAWDKRGASLGGGSRQVAVVAPSHEGFGLARMYEMARGQSRDTLKVFTDRAHAMEWLRPRATSALA